MKRATFTLVPGLLGLLLLATPAEATVQEWLMTEQGLDPFVLRAAPSVRLMGLGDVDLAVEDEANELNLYDYAGNIAGLYGDSDRWVAESWLGNHLQTTARDAFSSERRYGHSGFHLVYRSASRALGAEVNWSYLESSDVPGDWDRVRGPLISALINQRLGPLTLGFALGRESENEDRHSADYFSIRHRQSRMIGRFGLQADLMGWLVGAEWTFERGDVEGKSADPARFHEDTYVWKRPADHFVLAAILPRRGPLEGGVRMRLMDREGSEEVNISWSDDSPRNPSRTDYFDDAVAFREEESALELSSRWRVHMAGGTIVGFEASYEDWDLSVAEGINFKGSRDAGTWTDQAISAGIGVSHLLLEGRLLASLQARGKQADWSAEDKLSRTEATSRTLVGSAGLEFFARDDIALRGGGSIGSFDRDRDAPLTLQTFRGGSIGASWLPRGGLIQVHAAVRYARWEPEDADAVQLDEEDETSYALSLRLLL